MKTLTMCGSMRFEKEMQQIAFLLETRYGFNVLQCTYSNKNPTEMEKENIVKAHNKKIDLSDAVYIVDIDNHIGISVQSEIEYAVNKNKEIIYHSAFISDINKISI
ncbi:MAG: hypothetical protein E7483_03140 [Ruminococcaceae bacterium]|nr:hypothetical protein [Oscillospiraceae bacterium]